MSNTHRTSYDLDKLVHAGPGSNQLDEWYPFYSSKFGEIDYARLKKDSTEIPVLSRDPETVTQSELLSHIYFRADEDKPGYMIVVDSSQCKKYVSSMENGKTYCSYEDQFSVPMSTKMEVITFLFKALRHRKLNKTTNERWYFDYGDVNTLKSWGETFDVTGYIGKSSGDKKAFLLINNSRSMGGGSIMTDQVLSIRTARYETGTKEYYYPYILNEFFTVPMKGLT